LNSDVKKRFNWSGTDCLVKTSEEAAIIDRWHLDQLRVAILDRMAPFTSRAFADLVTALIHLPRDAGPTIEYIHCGT